MDNIRASVIVLAWNGIEYLGPCLDTVLAQKYADFEVIVVDNGSTDGSADFVAEHYPHVRLIRNEQNLGFAAGNNVGLAAASGDVLVLLNQDTQAHEGWLEALVSTFDDATIGIAGCKLLYPDGTIQHAGGYVHGLRGETEHVGRHEEDDGRFDQLADIEYATAAAVAIRRPLLEQIGPLDEAYYPAYYEDVDWSYRARGAGLRVVYQPSAVVTHQECSTTVDPASHGRQFAAQQGRMRFVFKHFAEERLLSEFGPAELEWVSAAERNEEVMAARRAYLDTMLSLPDIVAFRQGSPAEALVLADLLVDLRAGSIVGLSSPRPSPAGEVSEAMSVEETLQRQRLEEMQTVREVPFSSQVPVLGRLFVAFRSLWNSMSTKWYVRPLLQQQNAFNAEVVKHLQAERRDVAENVRELTFLAQEVAALKTALLEHSGSREED
jgi:GT2 family glycosyltransferase